MHQMRRALSRRNPFTFTFTFSPKLHFSTNTTPIHLPKTPISRSPSLNTLPTPLKQHLLSISQICPSTSRKFLRFQDLKPLDLLEILENFHLGSRDLGFNHEKVESLWRIFNWVSDRNKGFGFGDDVVDPRCYEIMGLSLLRVGMIDEVEVLVSGMKFKGNLVGRDRILSGLMGEYVEGVEVEKAVSVYERMRVFGLETTLACCRGFLRFMMEMDRREMVVRVVDDMVNAGVGFGDDETKELDSVIRVLCRDGKVQLARKFVRNVKVLGLEPSSVVLNEIGSLFCDKKDFDDLVSFFGDMGCAPDSFVCNKALHLICGSFGLERADQFLQEVKQLGFCPNEATFGILVCWSCQCGKPRNAFIYFSEIISRGMSAVRWPYNALMSGLFKEGMWQHAREVLNEMIDNGVKPDLVTFKVLLAGYCKARQFGEVKRAINDMVQNSSIQLAPLEDPLSRAFLILELDAKVKRDNNKGCSLTEFYDDLGNGLYLETDLDKFEQVVSTVLEESMIPDFNRIIEKECELNNLKAASLAVDEMFVWGQELSLNAFTALAKSQCVSYDHVPALSDLLKSLPSLIPLLKQEILTWVVLSFSDKDFAEVGPLILKELCRSQQPIGNNTRSSLMLGICRTGEARTIRCCWALARKEKWLPELKDCGVFLDYLCQMKMRKEAIQLFDSMLAAHPHSKAEICNVFLEKLCLGGYTGSSHEVINTLLHQGFILEPTVYSHLIRGYCKEKRDSEAMVIIDDMLAHRIVPSADTLVLVIPLLCSVKRANDATVLYEIGIKEHCSHSVFLYDALISGCCRIGQGCYGLVDFVLDEMQRLGLQFDEVTYNFLIYGYASCKQMTSSMQYLNSMSSKELRPSNRSLRAVAHYLCSSREVQKTLDLSKDMESRGWTHSSVLQHLIVNALWSAGRYHEAESFLARMEEKDLIPDKIDYNILIRKFSHGRLDTAIDLLNIMLKKGSVPDSISYNAVVCSSCVSDKLNQAMDLFNEMLERKLNPAIITWDELVDNLCQNGRTLEAERLLISMVDYGLTPTRRMYCSIVDSYCCENNLSKASELMGMMQHDGYEPDFGTHWYLISSMWSFTEKDDSRSLEPQGFLSKLLSDSGFSPRKVLKTTVH
ncbi:Pentatricopeptide repeat-containing protein [Drosera capensis]